MVPRRDELRGLVHSVTDAAHSAGAIGPEHLLDLIRTGAATSRGGLARLTGLSRSTVAQRVDSLIDAGFVREKGSGESSGGRPPVLLEFDGSRRGVLTVAIEPATVTAALVTVAGAVVERRVRPVRVEEGPEVVLAAAGEELQWLLHRDLLERSAVCGIGVSVPAPVEHITGRPIEPTIMPGWHECPIREQLEDAFDLPVYVDNDANAMATAEYRRLEPSVGAMLYIRASDGIGAGLVLGGHLYRGTVGSAGAIGHMTVDGSTAACTCGNVGCVAAIAGGRALAVQLRASGEDVSTAADVVALARHGSGRARAAVRAAGRDLGRVLAGVVNLLDPGAVVIGGEFAEVDDFLAGIREEVYKRALPLAAGHLRVVKAVLGEDAAIIGAASLVAEELLAPRPITNVPALSRPAS